MEGNGRRKVLIVDGTTGLDRTLNRTLKKHGYGIAGVARDGAEALDMYTSLRPDVVAVDILNPEEGGVDIVKSIVAADGEARIIVISGPHQLEMVMEAMAAGARDFLIRPFEPGEVRSALVKSLT